MLFFFRFESNLPYTGQLPVRLISDQVLSHVEFRSSPDPTAKNLLSKLSFRFSLVNVDHTVSPTKDSRNSHDTSLFTELSLVAEVIDGPNDDSDDNEDSNNSDGGENGGNNAVYRGSEEENDDNMGSAEGEQIATCTSKEHELSQQIQYELSLRGTVESLDEPVSHKMKTHT